MRATVLLSCLLLLGGFAHAQPAQGGINKGAGVPQAVIDAYEALDFDGMPYRFLLPADYDPAKQYPLILSLHGRAGVGDNNRSQMRKWTATFVDEAWRAKYPCIVVAPQAMDSWYVDGQQAPEMTEALLAGLSDAWKTRIQDRPFDPNPVADGPLTKAFALVDQICAEYPVDTNRIYVLGHSMGGFGSWNAIWAAPERFAAAIPTAGGLPPWQDYAKFRDVPIWAFHGDADPTVPVEYTREIFARIAALGGNLKYTELKDVKHNAEQFAFAYQGDDAEKGYITRYSSARCDKTPSIWDWLFRQRRDAR